MNEMRILLVEDNPDDVRLTVRAMRKHRLEKHLVVARDGEAALDYLFGRNEHADRDIAEQPAVILLDMNLPRLNGLEVLRQVRAHAVTRLIPVVMLTSSREQQDLNRSYSLGVNSYVQKPVDSDVFDKTLQQLGAYWLTINILPA